MVRGHEERELFGGRSTTPKRNKHDGSCMYVQKKHLQKEIQKVSSITSVDMVITDHCLYGLRMFEITGKMTRTTRRGQGSCRTATSSRTSDRRCAELHQRQRTDRQQSIRPVVRFESVLLFWPYTIFCVLPCTFFLRRSILVCDTDAQCAPPDTESHASLSLVVAPHSKCLCFETSNQVGCSCSAVPRPSQEVLRCDEIWCLPRDLPGQRRPVRGCGQGPASAARGHAREEHVLTRGLNGELSVLRLCEWLLEVAYAVIWAVLLCSVVCPICVWDLRWLLFLLFSSFRPLIQRDRVRLAVQMLTHTTCRSFTIQWTASTASLPQNAPHDVSSQNTRKRIVRISFAKSKKRAAGRQVLPHNGQATRILDEKLEHPLNVEGTEPGLGNFCKSSDECGVPGKAQRKMTRSDSQAPNEASSRWRTSSWGWTTCQHATCSSQTVLCQTSAGLSSS